MPRYVKDALQKLQYISPKRKQRAPHKWNVPSYGAKIQFDSADTTLPSLSQKDLTCVSQIVDIFVYYNMAIYNTMLVALGTITSQQAKATSTTMAAANMLLDYAASNPIAKICYHVIDIQLYTHNDASYVSKPKSLSQGASVFLLSNCRSNPKFPPTTPPPLNGALNIVCKIMRKVMGSAADAEITAAYMTTQEAVPIRTTLEDISHSQDSTPVQVDNTTCTGFPNDTIKKSHQVYQHESLLASRTNKPGTVYFLLARKPWRSYRLPHQTSFACPSYQQAPYLSLWR